MKYLILFHPHNLTVSCFFQKFVLHLFCTCRTNTFAVISNSKGSFSPPHPHPPQKNAFIEHLTESQKWNSNCHELMFLQKEKKESKNFKSVYIDIESCLCLHFENIPSCINYSTFDYKS